MRSRSRAFPCLLLLATAGCLTAAGCEVPALTLWLCKNPDFSHTDKADQPDPCHYSDCPACIDAYPNADAKACGALCDADLCEGWNGQCVDIGDPSWNPPALLWIGPSTEAPPDCPGGLETESSLGADADWSDPCTCDCEAPAGSCALSSTFTASTALCHAGGTSISFDALASWTGACTSVNPIPASAGVESLTIEPLVKSEGECPQMPVVLDPPAAKWRTVARVCALPLFPKLCKPERFCTLMKWLPSDFKYCISADGEHHCTPNFPDQHVLYRTADVPDSRHCAPCTCDPKPVGSKCAAQVSIYQDSACATAPLFSRTVDSERPYCSDVPLGAPLGSKSAGPSVYTHGDCSGISSVLGELDLEDNNAKVTYCCKDAASEVPR